SDVMLPPYTVFASAETAAQFNVDQLNQLIKPSTLNQNTNVIGRIYPAVDLAAGTLLMDIGAAQHLLGVTGKITTLYIPAEAVERRSASFDEAINAAQSLIETADRLVLVDNDLDVDAGRLSGSFHLNLTAFGLLAFLVGLLIVHSVISLAFEQRKGTFRTLQSSGVSSTQAIASFAIEVVLVAIVAGTIGVVFGFFLASLILPSVSLTLGGLYGEQVSGVLSVSPVWVLSSLGIAVLGALGAALTSFVKLSGLKTLEVARREAWATRFTETAHRDLGLSASILVFSFVLSRVVGGLIGGFVIMGAVLIAAALTLPSLLSWVNSVFKRTARTPISEWFWADTRQQLPALALALQALLIALSANIGVSTMVGGFRDTFVGWLDQRLAADLFLRNDPDGEIHDWLLIQDEVDRIIPFGFDEARLDDRAPVRVLAITDDPLYRENWPLIRSAPEPWDALSNGDGVIVNEQLLRRRDLSIGDKLFIATPGGPWEANVVAAYSDYGNPMNEIMTSVSVATQKWPAFEPSLSQVVLREGMGDAASTLVARAQDEFDIDTNSLVDQRALKAFSITIFEQTFLVTDALSVLTLVVSGIALFTGLAALSSTRITQVAPLWAIGVTRDQLALLDLAKTVMLSILTAIVAIPLGIFVAWLLTAVVNVEAFGWRLPLFHYPSAWIRLIAVAVLISLVASIPAFLSLRSVPSSALLKSFASER
ncbi:MAG: ABC transporter permease, partial [Pseudomonadota bacterium]